MNEEHQEAGVSALVPLYGPVGWPKVRMRREASGGRGREPLELSPVWRNSGKHSRRRCAPAARCRLRRRRWRCRWTG